ncbi:TetR/AcrR family transcriptional regulator [Archangium violaceum]|uniref:TetR/AcrR family transcriptional regulator n=1 Tax=Archangium violaceum TaxID=83451 RepID=UPI00193C8635|nr:TetR/AcrR family transcriptional regulator [Archangium violaceum]QRK06235.1 TetR/AcrR family transcriptional regulator [Archangium violaceum]
MGSDSKRERVPPPRKARRRRLASSERRSELLDAAYELLKTRGEVGLRVEDITRAAGAAKGTFYLYFESVDALLLALRERVVQEYAAAAATRLGELRVGLDWWAWMEKEVGAFIDFQVELGPLHRALFHGPVSLRPSPEGLSAEVLVAGMLHQGAALGAISVEDVETTASLVFHLIHGSADSVADGADRQRVIAATCQLLREGLRVTRER